MKKKPGGFLKMKMLWYSVWNFVQIWKAAIPDKDAF